MIKITPFSGYRPHHTLVEKIASLPYDVVTIQEAKEIVKDNPYSFLNIDKYEVHLGENVDKQEIYKGAEAYLNKFINEKILVPDLEESIYIYRIQDEERIYTSIIACISCEDYSRGKIKRHEMIRAEKKNDRMLHINTCSYQWAPIMIMHEESSEAQRWILKNTMNHKAIYDFRDEKEVRHTIFKISSMDQIAEINNIFKSIQRIYLVDGHHRAESFKQYAELKKENDFLDLNKSRGQYILSAIFGCEQLSIKSYNRVIKISNSLNEDQIWKQLKKNFDINEILQCHYSPQRKNVLGMRYKKRWYELELKDKMKKEMDLIQGLDVNILQVFILEEIFGILDPTIDKNIEFVGASKGIEELNKRTDEEMDVAFSLCAIDMREFMAIVDSGKLMPPKSTWFEPKIRRGLFIYK